MGFVCFLKKFDIPKCWNHKAYKNFGGNGGDCCRVFEEQGQKSIAYQSLRSPILYYEKKPPH